MRTSRFNYICKKKKKKTVYITATRKRNNILRPYTRTAFNAHEIPFEPDDIPMVVL